MKFRVPVYDPCAFDAKQKEIEMLDPVIFEGAERFIDALYPDLHSKVESLMQTSMYYTPEQILFDEILPQHRVILDLLSLPRAIQESLVLDVTQFEKHGRLNIADKNIDIPMESFDQKRLICLKLPAGLMSTTSGVPYWYRWFTLFPSNTTPGAYYPVELEYKPQRSHIPVDIHFHYERIWRTWTFRLTSSSQYVLEPYINQHARRLRDKSVQPVRIFNKNFLGKLKYYSYI